MQFPWSSKLSATEGNNVNQPTPSYDFFKRIPIAFALTILGAFGLAIALRRWGASDIVSRRYSIGLAVTGIAVGLPLLLKGLTNLFRSTDNKERPDSAASPSPVEPQVITLSPEQQPPQIYRASVSILTITGWYVGDPACCISFYPDLGKITLEDGSPLPLHPGDFLIPVCLNDQSCPSIWKAISHALYLPYTFLKTRKERTAYQLKYDGIPLEFSIDQTQHKNLRMHRSLPKILDLIALYVKQYRPVEPMCTESIYDRTGFYKLGTEGSIFNGVTQGSRVTLKEVSSTNFRPKQDPEFASGRAYIENNQCNFRCEMPTIAIEDVDIIVNETLLMIYARTKHGSPYQPHDLNDLSTALFYTNTMDEKTLKAFRTGEREWIFGITWTCHAELNNLGVEKMKQQVQQGILHYKNDILRFAFPLATDSSPKVLFEVRPIESSLIQVRSNS